MKLLEKLIEIRPGIGSVVSELSTATKAQRDQILNNEVDNETFLFRYPSLDTSSHFSHIKSTRTEKQSYN